MYKYGTTLLLIMLGFFSFAENLPGLVARYSFNRGKIENDVGVTDPKAYGVNMTEDRFGNPASACYFQGNADSYLTLGTSPILKPKNGTISLWIKIDQAIYKGKGFECNPIIFVRSHGEDDFNEAYALVYHYNLRKLHCNASISELAQITVYPATTSYLRQWYHLVMTYDDREVALYINGVLEAKAAKNFETVFLESDSVIVGCRNGLKNKRYLQGVIDDIEIYNRVLSSKEVLKLYNEPNPNKSFIIIRWIIYSILLIAIILSIILILKWRINTALRKEKEKNKLRNNWYEQENKVLMAQMDPHFIFNSLNTIQQFIIINDNDKAQLYLSKFSRLLRMILESNVKDRISLKEEVDILTQYLEIESLRFNNVYSYKINIPEELDLLLIEIPRFLIQPFIENAIWHGILPKEGDKNVTISFEWINESALKVIIEDNGIGRVEAKKRKSLEKNKSLAINFIEQRLQLMSKIYKEEFGVEIIDKLNKEGRGVGTKVIVRVPILRK